jgi:hypothetical protein
VFHLRGIDGQLILGQDSKASRNVRSAKSCEFLPPETVLFGGKRGKAANSKSTTYKDTI